MFLLHAVILRGHTMLDLDRAARGIDRAGKFNQHAVASSIDDPSAMGRDCSIDKGLSDRLEPSDLGESITMIAFAPSCDKFWIAAR
jgi:hypothetical protein